MNIALSLLTAADTAAESGTIDRLQALGDAKLQVADPDYWGSVGIIALTGILVVFIILALLIFFFWAMGALFSSLDKKKKAKAQAEADAKKAAAPAVTAPAAPVIEDEPEEDDAEIIAVISAAIAAYSEQDGRQYAITSIKRKDNKARSAWSLAGIGENTRPF